MRNCVLCVRTEMWTCYLTHILIGSRNHFCILVVWTWSIHTECKLDVDWSLRFVNWLESSSGIERPLACVTWSLFNKECADCTYFNRLLHTAHWMCWWHIYMYIVSLCKSESVGILIQGEILHMYYLLVNREPNKQYFVQTIFTHIHGYTVIREIFVGKIFSWGKSTTKIKRTKIFIRWNIATTNVAGTPSRV